MNEGKYYDEEGRELSFKPIPNLTPVGSELARWTFAAIHKILSGEKSPGDILPVMQKKFPQAGF